MRSCAVGLALALVHLLPGGIAAQTCPYDFHDDYEQLTRLTDEHVPTSLDGHSKTELIAEGFVNATDQRQETWYLAHDASCPGGGFMGRCCPGGSGELYRAYNAAMQDSRDSPVQSDMPGFATDFLLGCPWTSRSRQGLTPVRRYFDGGIHDYMTWLFSSTPQSYSPDATWYVNSPTPRLAYQRFGNRLAQGDVLAAAYDAAHTLDNGYLKVQLNRIWGDGIGRITHEASGTQIVEESIGDMVQTVLRFGVPGGDGCRGPNPTQSGGADCNVGGALNYSHTERWAGSPVVSEAISGSDPISFTSVVRPFDFCHNGANGSQPPWSGGVDDYSPLAWKGLFQRTDTLSCKLGSLVRRDMLKTSSSFQLGEGYSGSTPRTVWEINTAWLQAAPLGDARVGGIVVELVDLASGAVTPIPISYSSAGFTGYATPMGSTGRSYALVASRQDGSFAYAVVMKNLRTDDYVDVALHCGATCDPNSVAIVLRANRLAGSITTGSWSTPIDSFLVINNHAAVLKRLAELQADDGDCMN